MASNPMSKRSRLSFFKILVGDLIFTKLRVPPAFLKNLKRIKFPTQSTIALMSDTRVRWTVKMEKMEGEVYFTVGWEKVLKDMKLEMGDFLVFYLVGAVAFELRAYDKTCSQRCYLVDEYDSNYEEQEENEDDSNYEEQEANEDNEEEEEVENNVLEPDMSTSSRKGNWRLKAAEREAALGRAKTFVSTNPYFLRVMQPSYLCSSYHLQIPASFVKKYKLFKERLEGTVKLHCGGRIWSVRYHNNFKTRFFWRDFALDNMLVVGDVCAFELMKKNIEQSSFQVTIFRASN